MPNIDPKTVKSFGDEWSRFRQDQLTDAEHEELFQAYFRIFPWESLPSGAKGFDMGCGSGRWAQKVAPQVDQLTCIDPFPEALDVAKQALSHHNNITFLNAGVSDNVLTPESQDFGYSLGVLHHIPDTRRALESCVSLLKPGAPFLIYLYYRFDNRPGWFRTIWWLSNLLRKLVITLPPRAKNIATDIAAILIYVPLARSSLIAERLGARVNNWPLSSYRACSFYTMRTDSRDRFGTPLEQRFTRVEVQEMMEGAGLENIGFSDTAPFWCAVGFRKPAA